MVNSKKHFRGTKERVPPPKGKEGIHKMEQLSTREKNVILTVGTSELSQKASAY